MMHKKRILLMGPIAPPYGGVSIHILRLVTLLENDFQFDFVDESNVRKREYFNLRSLNLYLYLKKLIAADLVYIHSGKNSLRCFHLILGKIFAKKTILTIHSFKYSAPKFMIHLYRTIFKLSNTIVIVNNELKDRLLARNYDYVVKEAFIPPLIENEPALPEYIFNWLTINKKDGNLIICANASHLETFNNQDLYGLDLCIEVTKRLVSQNLPVKFLFVVGATKREKAKYLKKLAFIKQLNLSDHFFLISERLSFVKVIELCDIVLRPTNTDGDALTVREALFLNKMVLASDVVKRPANVFLFKNRHIEDLEAQLKKLIISFPTQYNSKGQRYMNSTENVKTFYLELLENTLRKGLTDYNPKHTKELI